AVGLSLDPPLPKNLSDRSHRQSLRRHPLLLPEGCCGLPSAAPLSPPPPSRRGGLPRRSRCSDLGVHDAEIRVHDAPIFAFTIGRSGRSRWTETRTRGAASGRCSSRRSRRLWWT